MRTYPLDLDAAIGQVASGQYGLISMAQALSLGVSPDAVRRRVAAGLLIRMAPGVFRLAGAPRSWQQRAAAGAMWIAGDGAVGGQAAAALHRLDGFGPPVAIEVVTPRNVRSNRPLLKVRRTPFWLDEDRVTVSGIAVTSVERTLIDVAGMGSEERLEIALEDALRRRLTIPEKVLRRLEGLPLNQPGRGRLARLVQERGATRPAESPLEVKVLRLLREEGYPRPLRQKVLDDDGRFVGRVDLVWPERRLILEVDSFRFHSGRISWDRDRERRNALTALAWIVMHVTSTMLKDQRQQFLQDLSRAYHRPL